MWFTEWSHVKTNKQTNKQRKKQKTKTKTWEYTHYENIILLITGYHMALGWAVGVSPHDIDLWTQTVMYLNRLLYLWNHWWALQFNWLSVVWFIRESPDFLLQITSVLNNVIHVLAGGGGRRPIHSIKWNPNDVLTTCTSKGLASGFVYWSCAFRQVP